MRIGQPRNIVIKTNPENSRLGLRGTTSYCKEEEGRQQSSYDGHYSHRNERRTFADVSHKAPCREHSERTVNERSLPENIEKAMMVEAPERGAIYLVDFGDDKSCCLTAGVRPAICISTDSYHGNSPILRVVPMTRHFKSIDAGYHVFVNRDKCAGLRESGMAMGEQTRPVDRSMIIRKIGVITDDALFDEILFAADAIVKSYK